MRGTATRTGPTARTGVFTARTSCSPGSPTRSSPRTAWTRSPTARTPTTPAGRTGPAPAPQSRTGRALALPCADKPAAPCLASRIPHFADVTPAKLRQVELAEAALHRLGFAELRVRHHGEVARIELPAGDLLRAVTDPMRGAVREAVVAAGFRFATVDLAGVQSGAFTLPLVSVTHA
jgi:uncharacterized protein